MHPFTEGDCARSCKPTPFGLCGAQFVNREVEIMRRRLGAREIESMRYVATSVARITVFFMTSRLDDGRKAQPIEQGRCTAELAGVCSGLTTALVQHADHGEDCLVECGSGRSGAGLSVGILGIGNREGNG